MAYACLVKSEPTIELSLSVLEATVLAAVLSHVAGGYNESEVAASAVLEALEESLHASVFDNDTLVDAIAQAVDIQGSTTDGLGQLKLGEVEDLEELLEAAIEEASANV